MHELMVYVVGCEGVSGSSHSVHFAKQIEFIPKQINYVMEHSDRASKPKQPKSSSLSLFNGMICTLTYSMSLKCL